MSAQLDKNLSLTFDWLRFPLALLVVYLHIAPSNVFIQASYGIDSPYFWATNIVDNIANLAVPAFYIISGYLMAFNMTSFSVDVYLSKLKRRSWTLFVPYLIWNLLCVGYLFLTGQISECPEWDTIFLDPINFPLWFIRNLIVLNLLYPILWVIVRYLRWPFFIIVIIAYLLIPTFQDTVYIHPYALTSFVYFYIGVYGGINMISLNTTTKVYAFGMFILAAFSFILVVLSPIFEFRTSRVYHIYLLSGTITLFLLAYKLIEVSNIRPIPLLTAASSFIYLSHKLGPTYISKQIVGSLLSDCEVSEIIIFIVSPVIASLICIGTYYLLSKTHPTIIKVLTGKR